MSFLLVAAACNGAAGDKQAQSWPKVSRLRDGSTVSVWRSGRVVQRDRLGRLESDSDCGSYPRYLRWVDFMTSFRSAVVADDRRRVAALVHYPVRWNHGRPNRTTLLVKRIDLLRHYDSIFQPSVAARVRASSPKGVFCENVTQAMIGSGVVWGDEWGGRHRIFAINGASNDRATLATFAGDWSGHTRSLTITDDGRGRESIYSGCCDPVLDLRFRLSSPSGTSRVASATATVTAVRVLDKSAYTKAYPAPRVGDERTLRLREGVITDELTGANYCDGKPGHVWKCGA